MKKLLIFSIVISSLLTLPSCYVNRAFTTQNEYRKCLKQKNGKYIIDTRNSVFSLSTRKGDTIFFNKKFPGKIYPKQVGGLPQIRISFGDADSTAFNESSLETVWQKGVGYHFITQDSAVFVCYAPDSVFIPLTDIVSMDVRKFSKGATGAAVVMSVTVPVVAVFLYFLITQPIIDIDISGW